MTYGLFGKIQAHPGRRSELVSLLLEAAALLEHDPTCIQYLISTPFVTDDPESVVVFEVWEDESAHAASLQRQELLDVITKARPLIAGFSDRHELTVVGGKGTPERPKA